MSATDLDRDALLAEREHCKKFGTIAQIIVIETIDKRDRTNTKEIRLKYHKRTL